MDALGLDIQMCAVCSFNGFAMYGPCSKVFHGCVFFSSYIN
jgi:hypothetical protein